MWSSKAESVDIVGETVQFYHRKSFAWEDWQGSSNLFLLLEVSWLNATEIDGIYYCSYQIRLVETK